MTGLSFRGYDVVAVSAYIAGQRESNSLRAQGMNFASELAETLKGTRCTNVRGGGGVYPQSSVSGQIKHEAAAIVPAAAECFYLPLARRIPRATN